MNEVFEYFDESFLKNIPCFLIITRILKAHGIKFRSMPSVQKFLISSVTGKTTFNNIYYFRQALGAFGPIKLIKIV
jgi:hypothetical protein